MNGSADIVVIGGGLAGLTAANRAAELGRSVIVLEAGTDEDYYCNSRICMGFINVAMGDIEAGPASMRRSVDAVTRGFAKPELRDALAENAQAALRWLRRQGVTIIKGTWRPSNQAMLAPPSAIGAGLTWRGRGGDRMLRVLAAQLNARGGELRRGMRARELVMRDGACAGVIVDKDGHRFEISSREVLIADGGFQGDAELLRQYVTPHPDRVLVRNAGTGRGDGLRMAISAGAATAGMGGFYGHVQSRDALNNPKLWPYPTLDMALSGGVVVDSNGQRFCDEGLSGVHVANVMAKRDDPLDAFVVFDHTIWMQRAIEFPLPCNPLLVRHGGTLHAANDISSLAALAGIEAAGLAATIAAHNEATAAGKGAELSPPRSSHAWKPMLISTPPFYVAPAVAGVTYTTGGIAIDGFARVLREDGSIIRGLYAAGSCTGGHEGGPVSGYTGGLGKALTFGFIAGNVMAGANSVAA
jgi:fumarate reductase flavoprotein subunit